MTLLRTLFLAAALAAGLTSAPALADPPRRGPDRANQAPRGAPDRASQAPRRNADQVGRAPRRDADRAFQAIRQGRSMPLPQLEQRVMPLMGGADYLGPELNGSTYRFKFIQNGRVIWVDVDGQGRIVRRSRDR